MSAAAALLLRCCCAMATRASLLKERYFFGEDIALLVIHTRCRSSRTAVGLATKQRRRRSADGTEAARGDGNAARTLQITLYLAKIGGNRRKKVSEDFYGLR